MNDDMLSGQFRGNFCEQVFACDDIADPLSGQEFLTLRLSHATRPFDHAARG
jgi:hypothetical protein